MQFYKLELVNREQNYNKAEWAEVPIVMRIRAPIC